jgi:hypothetical protein
MNGFNNDYFWGCNKRYMSSNSDSDFGMSTSSNTDSGSKADSPNTIAILDMVSLKYKLMYHPYFLIFVFCFCLILKSDVSLMGEFPTYTLPHPDQLSQLIPAKDNDVSTREVLAYTLGLTVLFIFMGASWWTQ